MGAPDPTPRPHAHPARHTPTVRRIRRMDDGTPRRLGHRDRRPVPRRATPPARQRRRPAAGRTCDGPAASRRRPASAVRYPDGRRAVSAPPPSDSHQRHVAPATRTDAAAEGTTAEQDDGCARACGMPRRLPRETPPDGFRVVIVPSAPELNLPTAAALLRILTRHVSPKSDATVSGDDVPTGPPGTIELSVVDHTDHLRTVHDDDRQ